MEKGKEEKDSKIMTLNQESLHFGHCNATSSSTNMLDYMHRYHGMHASHGTQDRHVRSNLILRVTAFVTTTL